MQQLWTYARYVIAIVAFIVLVALDIIIAILIVDGKIAPIGYIGIVGVNAALIGAGWAALPQSEKKQSVVPYLIGFAGVAISVGFHLYRTYLEAS